MFQNRTINIIVALVLAVLLWAYVMISINPQATKEFTGIEIEYINGDDLTSRGLAVADTETITADVVVEGNMSELNNITASDVSVTVDLQGKEEGTNAISVSVQLPTGISLKSVSPSSLSVMIEERTSYTEEIVLLVSGDLPTGYKVTSSSFDPETVIISGAKSAIEQVESVVAKVSASDIVAGTNIISASLTAVNKDGEEVLGITYSEKTTIATIETLIYDDYTATRIFYYGEEDIVENNLGDELTAEISDQNIKVTISGTQYDLENMSKSDITLSVSLLGLTAGTHIVPITAVLDSTGEIEVSPSQLEVVIE